MTEQMQVIGERMRTQREILDVSASAMAQQLNIPLQEYLDYEAGKLDFAFSFLYRVAEILSIDILDLMTGDSPKLNICSIVRAGKGFAIERRTAYKYQHLAFTMRNKKAEPFMVTVEYNQDDQPPHLNQHEGQEFDYIIQGSMKVLLAGNEYVLNEGDSIYYDSSYPHAMQAVGGKAARFLAVVIK